MSKYDLNLDGRVDFHERYLASLSGAEMVLSRVADAVFTVWSFLLHAIVYTIAWKVEGGDHHLFLDAISIEAVFVSMSVGIQTKLAGKRDKVAQEQRDFLQHSMEQLIEENTKLTDEIHAKVVS